MYPHIDNTVSTLPWPRSLQNSRYRLMGETTFMTETRANQFAPVQCSMQGGGNEFCAAPTFVCLMIFSRSFCLVVKIRRLALEISKVGVRNKTDDYRQDLTMLRALTSSSPSSLSSLSSLKPSSRLAVTHVSIPRRCWETFSTHSLLSRLVLSCLSCRVLSEIALRVFCLSSPTTRSSSPSSSSEASVAMTRRSWAFRLQVEGTIILAIPFCIRWRSETVEVDIVSMGRYWL